MKELNINSLHRFPTKSALWSLFLLLIGGFLLTAFLSSVLMIVLKGNEIAALQLSVVLQNIFTFIVPAILMALIVFRRPLTFLSVDKKPSLVAIVGIIVIYAVATPALNLSVSLNESLVLPQWLAPLEEWMKTSESVAKAMTDKLMDVDSIPQLIIIVLIIGVLTGMGEEIFFRGALQNILVKCIRNKHVAVWTAAIIFSAFHLQFYGFVPRMLIGAILGYSLLWSGSIWVPIIGHAFNNSMVVVTTYCVNHKLIATDMSEIGAEYTGFPTIAIISLAATIVLMVIYCHILSRDAKHDTTTCY